MNYPKQMVKCSVVGHKDYLKKTIDTIHEMNVLHIENFVEDNNSYFKIGKPIKYGEKISNKLVTIRSLENYLKLNTINNKQKISSINENLDNKINDIDNIINLKHKEIIKLENDIKNIEIKQEELKPFLDIDINLSNYDGYNSLSSFVGTIESALDENKISELTKNTYLLIQKPEKKLILLFIEKKYSENISKILNNIGYKEIEIPKYNGKPIELNENLDIEKIKLISKLKSLESEISDLKKEYGDFILASDELLTILSEKSELPLRIATSNYTFIIDGWIPINEYNSFSEKIKSVTNNKVCIIQKEINYHDEKEVNNIPVDHNNNNKAKYLEWIVDLYSRPKYNEVDPTNVLLYSLPIVYGMILGDIGYALILLVLGYIINKIIKSDDVKPFTKVLSYCQISTLLFGILYGEFLGFPLAGYLDQHTGIYTSGLIPGYNTTVFDMSFISGEHLMFPIHRTHLLMTLIIATAIFGFCHMNIGYIIGFINIKKSHGIINAIYEKGSWIIIEIGIILSVISFLKNIMITKYIGIIIFILGLILLYKGEGIKGPIELPGLFGNILSYCRIYAVGLSSIYIASTVNTIAFEMIWSPSSGFSLMTLASILMFVIGHLLNTCLSIIAPGLHALRLQYVEFFGKFYSGGGKKYSPFGHIRKYTKE